MNRINCVFQTVRLVVLITAHCFLYKPQKQDCCESFTAALLDKTIGQVSGYFCRKECLLPWGRGNS